MSCPCCAQFEPSCSQIHFWDSFSSSGGPNGLPSVYSVAWPLSDALLVTAPSHAPQSPGPTSICPAISIPNVLQLQLLPTMRRNTTCCGPHHHRTKSRSLPAAMVRQPSQGLAGLRSLWRYFPWRWPGGIAPTSSPGFHWPLTLKRSW